MKHWNKRRCKTALLTTLFISSGLFTACSYADERRPASEMLTQGTKDFLSDPARTGSLVGTILIGSAVANPLAPLLGSVAGFMIGKSSAFSKSDGISSQAVNKRSLLPGANTQISSLSGLTSKTTVAETVSSGQGNLPVARFPQIPETYLHSTSKPTRFSPAPAEEMRAGQTDHLVILGMSVVSGEEAYAESMDLPDQDQSFQPEAALGNPGNPVPMMSALQKQLANSCSNVQSTGPTSPACFYLSR